MPERSIPLNELRILLLETQTGWRTKNAVWAKLVRMARVQPEPWLMAGAGMMLPGMKCIAARFGSRFPGDRSDLDSEILEGFLRALRQADPVQPTLYGRLYRAAYRGGHEARARERRLAAPCRRLADNTVSTPSCRSRHPDLVLAAAMRDGAVTPHQADLLCGVHLDRARRVDLARRLGVTRYQVRLELTAAERGLAHYLIA